MSVEEFDQLGEVGERAGRCRNTRLTISRKQRSGHAAALRRQGTAVEVIQL